MSCKNKIIEEIAKILATAIVRKNSKKTLVLEIKQSDNCKKSKGQSKDYVK